MTFFTLRDRKQELFSHFLHDSLFRFSSSSYISLCPQKQNKTKQNLNQLSLLVPASQEFGSGLAEWF
jgi:hypothetical protein